jgi:cytochrome c peroxidase
MAAAPTAGPADGGVPGAGAGDVARGMALFKERFADWSCTTCHTADPRHEGRHAVTGRTIAPLAPVANPARLADPVRVEKWLRRNCRDVLSRECTAQEKSDVLAWLRSLR